jgi:hypothetical protein
MKERPKKAPKSGDPTKKPVDDVYNPLEKRNLAASIAKALLERPLDPLPPSEPFVGAGVYAIYYFGEDPLYRRVSGLDRDPSSLVPIYVGKAVPKGARKGGNLDADPGNALYSRLCDHRDSIESAANLSVADFRCRYLAVDDIFIPLGESLLVREYSPVWNVAIDGFGNHHPGSGRYQQKRSSWDVLHPGRGWAARLVESKHDIDVLSARIQAHFGKYLKEE